MKKALFIISTLLVPISYIGAQTQDSDIWVMKSDPVNNGTPGYVDLNDNVKIPFGKYRICFTDTFRTYAFVLHDNLKFVFIDRNDSILFEVYPFDNGPDYIAEGTFRIIKNNKVGIADTLGNTIIPPVYDFVYPFQDGLAVANIGGEKVPVEPENKHCEYFTWSGGKWGVLDKNNDVLLDIKYDLKFDEITSNKIFSSENESYFIKDGVIIRN
ncbi:MAG: WG repeat-containing protein [Bacteroidales bacterium]|nr:WG repeat-containing protein [Bacteroidales bacterium]